MGSRITTVESLTDRRVEPKKWGWEEWVVNNELYCGKRLHFEKLGGATSMHFHVRKHETMYVESGAFDIVVVNTTTAERIVHRLNAGQSIVIEPNTPHRIVGVIVPAVLVEFSTNHENSDSYRVEEPWDGAKP